MKISSVNEINEIETYTTGVRLFCVCKQIVYNVFEYGFIWIHKDITELFGRLIYSIKIL